MRFFIYLSILTFFSAGTVFAYKKNQVNLKEDTQSDNGLSTYKKKYTRIKRGKTSPFSANKVTRNSNHKKNILEYTLQNKLHEIMNSKKTQNMLLKMISQPVKNAQIDVEHLIMEAQHETSQRQNSNLYSSLSDASKAHHVVPEQENNTSNLYLRQNKDNSDASKIHHVVPEQENNTSNLYPSLPEYVPNKYYYDARKQHDVAPKDKVRIDNIYDYADEYTSNKEKKLMEKISIYTAPSTSMYGKYKDNDVILDYHNSLIKSIESITRKNISNLSFEFQKQALEYLKGVAKKDNIDTFLNALNDISQKPNFNDGKNIYSLL